MEKKENKTECMSRLNSIKDNKMNQKIAILRQSIYPKKLMKHSTSTKNIHPSIEGFQLKKDKKSKKETEPQPDEDIDEEVQKRFISTSNAKSTVFQFFPNKNKVISTAIKPQTLQSWFPSKSSASLKKKINIDSVTQKIQRMNDINPGYKEEYRPRSFPNIKDGQSLLRKNSLFLLNFIQMKQKKARKVPHIGEYPIKHQNTEDNPKLHLNRHLREKEFIDSIKIKKEPKKPQIIDCENPPLYPQPW